MHDAPVTGRIEDAPAASRAASSDIMDSDALDDGELEIGRQRTWRDLLPDPVSIWVIFRRRMRLFFMLFALTVLAVAVWTMLQRPVYLASSTLLVRPQADNVVDVKAVSPELPATSDIVNTQVRMMQSPAIASRVAARYLREHPASELARTNTPDSLARAISEVTQIFRVASTYVIEVDVRSRDPQEAADLANLWVAEYVGADKDGKVATNNAANDWLVSRTRQLEQDAKTADAALQDFKIRNGLISAEGTTLSEQEISVFNQQIAAAQADLAEKQGRLQSARQQLARGSGGADVGAALGSGTIGTLRTREAETSAKVAELSSRFGPSYPDLVRAKAELAAIRNDIQLEIDRILSNLEAEVHVASSRLASLEGSRSHSTGVLSNSNHAQVGLQELQRRSDAAKAIYQTFLNRSHETSAQQGLQRADTQIDSLADVPSSPDFPNRKLAALIGVVLGVFVATVGIGLAEYLQSGLRTKADIEQRLGLRYAGAVPTLASTLSGSPAGEPPHDYILSRPHSTFTEAFRSLATFMSLSARRPGGARRAVAICSALPQEGKTTTAVCLARTAAMDGGSVVLVDCDLRRRGSSSLMNYANAKDLNHYLRGASLDEVLVQDEASGLWVLGTNHDPDAPADPITVEGIARLIGELKQRFQLVVLDTAPLLALADSRAVAASADRVLFMSRWCKTSIRAAEAAVDLLEKSGARIGGGGLTQVDITSYASTGYSDTYSYHRAFRGYYTN